MISVSKKRIIKWLVVALPAMLIAFLYVSVNSRRTVCRLYRGPTIATVKYGPFKEYIPQTGQVVSDSLRGYSVNVNIDEL